MKEILQILEGQRNTLNMLIKRDAIIEAKLREFITMTERNFNAVYNWNEHSWCPTSCIDLDEHEEPTGEA